MGAAKQTKGRVGGQQRRQATRWGQRRQGQPATSRASHPPGAWFAPFHRAAGAPLQPNHAGI